MPSCGSAAYLELLLSGCGDLLRLLLSLLGLLLDVVDLILEPMGAGLVLALEALQQILRLIVNLKQLSPKVESVVPR